MSVLDEIYNRWGRGTLRAAAVLAWAMRRELMSPSYTPGLTSYGLVNAN
ncbi:MULTISPECIES: DUF4113 domain-containing protein [Pseudomonas]|nr:MULTISPECIES: DUF4113 domain-containing protein [Pseudomonas]ETK22703.1 protein UmuC [Pseudomonas sp. FH1]MDB1112638.1 DUF4113 domain-containing protein [Pseudomonas extremaustralis]